ncbi:MAG: hypothetical protein Unbinned706contig1001_10 [Prokaryotic dsDNA virus sp.]|nr:MAG: hypothetical protein Unbinned706contig1001_10 [Prokaryotic dsDNA virus sp.]
MIIIKIIGITWLLTHYNDFIEEFNQVLKRPKTIILIPKKILSCMMCCSFWVTLILTKDIYFSGFISMLFYLLDKYLIKTDIEL